MQHNAYLAISWGSKFKGKQKCTDWGINKTDKRTQKLRCSQSDTSISISCITTSNGAGGYHCTCIKLSSDEVDALDVVTLCSKIN